MEAKLNLNSAIEKIEVANAQKIRLQEMVGTRDPEKEDSLKEDKGFQKLLSMYAKQNKIEDGIEAIDPGVMDTSMQKTLRKSTLKDFPEKDYFVELKRDGKLKNPNEVARDILIKENLI